MKIPLHLSHRPIFTVEGYDKIDGPYARDTDAMGLSIGIAQWNGTGKNDLSAKVWRHTGVKWSRQSEELPLHRVLDLAALICNSIQISSGAQPTPLDEEFKVAVADNGNDTSCLLFAMGAELERNKEVITASLDRLRKAISEMK
jgi:hypothetical protein